MKYILKRGYNFIKKNIAWIIALICFIIFLSLVESVLKNEIMNLDIIIYDMLSKYIINDSITPIAKGITFLGGTYCLLGLTFLLIVFIKEKKIKWLIPINLAGSAGFNQILKRIVQRPRPSGFRIVDESGYSFPSGHSMVSMAFYGFLIYLVYKKIKNKYLKYSIIFLLNIQIILIGISRIYLGVHYASDVLAGFTLSIFYLILFIKGTNKFSNRKESLLVT